VNSSYFEVKPGNLWCGWGMTDELDGVRIFNPAGEPIGHIAGARAGCAANSLTLLRISMASFVDW
jgi:hypothetical protein